MYKFEEATIHGSGRHVFFSAWATKVSSIFLHAPENSYKIKLPHYNQNNEEKKRQHTELSQDKT